MRLFPLLLCLSLSAFAQDEPSEAGRGGRGGRGANEDPINERTFTALRARQIGPAMISGRISQIAMFPDSASHYMIALAAGNIFMTENNGTTWTPVFDNYGSYLHRLDHHRPQESLHRLGGHRREQQPARVAYGDGVYKSEDGGRTFRNVGLKTSEHIGRIVVDPRDSNVVYVAAQGPLWKGGGDRGLFKTTDGGKTWSQSLIKVDEYTGCTDIVMDPGESRSSCWPPPTSASAPTSASSTAAPAAPSGDSLDAGKTWTKVQGGFPQGRAKWPRPHRPQLRALQSQDHLRRSGSAPGTAACIRSTDGGITWERRNASDTQAQYYAKVEVDPADPDRVYVMGVNIVGLRRWRPHPQPASARATSTWTITISGSTRTTTITTWWAATAASTKARTAPPPGSSRRICPPASSTT